MNLLLSIETATTVCSIAIHKDGKLLSTQSLYLNQSHSSLLSPVIESLISYTGYSLSNLDGIVVSRGPGSYTGLRIGASTAKGLCYALDIPLISVNTLEAMALQVRKFISNKYLFCSMIDARRMEVYTTIVDSIGNVIQGTQPVIISEDSFCEILDNGPILFFGSGAEKCKNVITHSNASYIDNITPDAVTVGSLGFELFSQKVFEDVAYFEPYYLKEFMATKPKNL